MPRPRLVFLYSRRKMKTGSTVMRAFQLPQLVKPFLTDIEISSAAMPEFRVLQHLWARFATPGTVFFVTKHLVNRLHPDTVDILRRRNCRVCLDIVDLRSRKWPKAGLRADCLVSSSLSGVEVLKQHVAAHYPAASDRPMVLPVLHNADIRLYGKRTLPADHARFVYFGSRANAVLSDAILKDVTVLDGSSGLTVSQMLESLGNYNVHYAVRPLDDANDRTKPFTKGANAAAMGAVIVVNRTAPDAPEFLGQDYPFFTESTDEEEVLRVLEKAKSGFGSADWVLAQERCRDFADQISPESLASQLRHLMGELQ